MLGRQAGVRTAAILQISLPLRLKTCITITDLYVSLRDLPQRLMRLIHL